jgi:hypothetical protein
MPVVAAKPSPPSQFHTLSGTSQFQISTHTSREIRLSCRFNTSHLRCAPSNMPASAPDLVRYGSTAERRVSTPRSKG